MPSALVLATNILIALGASGTIAAIGAYVLAAGITIGFTAGLSAVLGAVFGPQRPKPSDGQLVFRGSVESRRKHYGIVHSSGLESFKRSRNGTLGIVLTLGTGREGPILEHRLHDEVVTLDGSGTVTQSSYHGAVHVYTRSGDPDQTAISQLTAKFPEWTADHRQLGCAHAAIICDPVDQEDFSEVYNGREPAYTQVRKGVSVYDPRLDSTAVIGTDGAGDPIYGTGSARIEDPDTWPWSDNWALVTANFFADPDGFGGGYDSVNWTNIAAEAEIADLTENTASGETIARWRIWASYKLAEEKRADILADMLKAGDGFCWQDADAKFNLMSGRWEEPELILTDDHIIAMKATQGPDMQDVTDAVRVEYTEAAIGYREQESARIGSLAVDAMVRKVPAYYAPHHNQAVRLGKIVLARLGADRWHFSVTCNILGIDLFGRRLCGLRSDRLGVEGWFLIEKVRFDQVSMRVEAQLAEVKPEDWPTNIASEEGTPPSAPPADTSTPGVSAPTSITASSVQISLGETTAVAIEVSWADPGRAGLYFEARYRPSAGGDWVAMSIDSANRTARSGPVDSGTEYEVQVRTRTVRAWASAWSPSVTITPVAASSLAAPTNLSATGGTGEADLSMRLPTSSSFSYARFYGSDSNDFGTAAQVGADIADALGATVTETDTGLSAGTRYYWARAFDGSGGSSALAGPVSATIS